MEVSPEELQELLARPGPREFRLVDVRTETDFLISRLDWAELIPIARMPSEAPKRLVDKDKPIVVYCRDGVDSKGASEMLQEQGYEFVFYLVGGLEAWRKKIDPTFELEGYATPEPVAPPQRAAAPAPAPRPAAAASRSYSSPSVDPASGTRLANRSHFHAATPSGSSGSRTYSFAPAPAPAPALPPPPAPPSRAVVLDEVEEERAPSASGEVSPEDLRDLMARPGPREFRLIDVREEDEFQICRLEWAELIPLAELPEQAPRRLVDKDRPLVVYCHHGMRSQKACEWLRRMGYEYVFNLTGGIEAWANRVEPGMKRY